MAGCACKSHDSYTCWSLRYHPRTFLTNQEIDQDGGPCECACHEPEHDSEDHPPSCRCEDCRFWGA